MRRALLAAATALVLGSQLPSTPANAAVNVYITPGNHTIAGRQWRTWCEKYTKDITRCRSEIKSGRTWVFNNLTYLPSARQQWGTNPLARNGTFTSGGYAWKTSCGDSWTGPNACRSFIRQNGRWVFNNIVNFTTGGASNMTADTTWRPWSPATTPVKSAPTSPSRIPAEMPTRADSLVNLTQKAFAEEVASLVNVERKKAGRAALRLDLEHNLRAQTCAEAQVRYGMNGPDLVKISHGFTGCGLGAGEYGETLAANLVEDSAADVVAKWMASPPHREILLTTSGTKVSAGYATQADWVFSCLKLVR